MRDQEQREASVYYKFLLKMGDLYKYTKSLATYNEESLNDWTNFKTKHQSCVKQLAVASGCITWTPKFLTWFLNWKKLSMTKQKKC